MPPLKLSLVSLAISLFLCMKEARSEATGYLFVSNEKTNNIAVVDPAQDYRIIKWISTSNRPTDMHFRNHGKQLLVACETDNVVDVIDVKMLEVTDHIPTGPGARLFQISRDSNRLYFSSEDTSTVQEIDITEKIVVREFATGAKPGALVLDETEMTLYVTSDIDDLVHTIDLGLGATTANIRVGTYPGRLSLSPNSEELWVLNEMSGQISIIDRLNNKITGSIEFLPPGLHQGNAAPVGVIAFVNTASRKIESYVSVGRWAQAVTLSHDEKTLFVANRQSDDLSIVDVEGHKLIGSIAVGGSPYAILLDK